MNKNEYNLCVDQHSDGIYHFILKHVKNSDTASDVVQDTFLKLWEKIEEISFEKAKSYLFSTAYHTMIDDVRKQNVHQKFVNFQPTTNHFESSYNDAYEVIQKAVDHLPADQKSVIMLRDYEGYSYEEIAEITGLSESQVKVYIYRARIALKNYLVKIENVI